MTGADRTKTADPAPLPAPIDGASLAECYGELRRIAQRILGQDGARLLIQPTELAHEAMIRLLQLERMRIESHQHLLSTAARLARQALIDEARRVSSLKRQAPSAMLTMLPETPASMRLEDVHAAVEALAQVSSDHADIVEMRFSLGMTVEEAAEATGLSARTVKRRWMAARTWLHDWLEANANRD